MNFWILYTFFIFVGFAICLVFGEAALLAYGIIFVFVCVCFSETKRAKSPRGRKQIQKELDTERKIEQYWGTVDYWEDK